MTLSLSSNVLVVDDDRSVRTALLAGLTGCGFAVEEAFNGEGALEAVQRSQFDLMLLDMNMPGLSGVETCRRIRTLVPGLGIIVLTVWDAEEDKIRALDAGADDYLTKPFRFGELKARLGAVRRRIRPAIGQDPPILRAGALQMDLKQRSLWKGSEEIHLSEKEFDLLAVLMKSQDVPLTHASLLEAVWGPDRGGEREYLRTYVRLLRTKIEDDSTRPQYLLTEPWLGYRFRNPRGPEYRHHRLPPFEPAKLDSLRIDQLREAIRGNLVSFPSQVPIFKKLDRPDLQQKAVQLYFVLGWNCERMAARYGVNESRIRQVLTAWKRRAVELGYIQYIPPAPWAPDYRGSDAVGAFAR